MHCELCSKSPEAMKVSASFPDLSAFPDLSWTKKRSPKLIQESLMVLMHHRGIHFPAMFDLSASHLPVNDDCWLLAISRSHLDDLEGQNMSKAILAIFQGSFLKAKNTELHRSTSYTISTFQRCFSFCPSWRFNPFAGRHILKLGGYVLTLTQVGL